MILNKKLEILRKNDSFLHQFNTGMSSLFQSGVFDVLREIGKCRILELGANAQVLATQAARSAGYNEALDDLMYFRETYFEKDNAVPTPPAEYGGLDAALLRGDLEKEEADAIRLGKNLSPADYASISHVRAKAASAGNSGRS